MDAWFIFCIGNSLEYHLKEAVLSEELGCCMDDIALDYIPPSWPLVTQVFAVVRLFGELYRLAENIVSEILIIFAVC